MTGLMRRLLPALAVLACLAPAAHAQAPDARPNVLLVMTDDQTAESLRVMSKLRGAVDGPGHEVHPGDRHLPAVLPVARHLSHRPVLAQPRRDPQRRAVRRLHAAEQREHAAGVDAARGLPDDSRGALPERIRHPEPGRQRDPPGWEDWNSTVDPTTFNFNKWTMNENGRVFEAGADGEFQTDFLGRRASEEIAQAAADPRPFFLSLTFPAPHSGTPVESDDPPSLRTPVPAPRHRNTFANVPVPRPPNFGRGRPLPTSPRSWRTAAASAPRTWRRSRRTTSRSSSRCCPWTTPWDGWWTR